MPREKVEEAGEELAPPEDACHLVRRACQDADYGASGDAADSELARRLAAAGRWPEP